MEPIVSAIASSRALQPQRPDNPAPSSEQQEVRVASAESVQASEKPSAEDVQRAAERLNEAIQEFNGDLSISLHKDTGTMVARVTDAKGNVIRQMPPEHLLEAEVSIDKIVGLFVNDTV